jgi:hypothetical protein
MSAATSNKIGVRSKTIEAKKSDIKKSFIV